MSNVLNKIAEYLFNDGVYVNYEKSFNKVHHINYVLDSVFGTSATEDEVWEIYLIIQKWEDAYECFV